MIKKESVLPKGKVSASDKACIEYARHMTKVFEAGNKATEKIINKPFDRRGN